ncbi:hypothetical protein Pse7429DRAFT_1926 [Pseudanabaena biceps PCC 7429]|uniref:Uncharacterized protein n=1 Tax=Pseudanabaena biceps PCC 7429 TaxID=927668 RepID=L8N2F2_9CYAN|nr:hypothetical protein Pse7429DRAFT_1926 [Pseudanabaena biceps PCC 7429]
MLACDRKIYRYSQVSEGITATLLPLSIAALQNGDD